jgi:hypothetical protein
MKGLTRENEVVKGIYNEVVPSKVDNQSFWSRYFYRMFKLKQAEEARALLVKRLISGQNHVSVLAACTNLLQLIISFLLQCWLLSIAQALDGSSMSEKPRAKQE